MSHKKARAEKKLASGKWRQLIGPQIMTELENVTTKPASALTLRDLAMAKVLLRKLTQAKRQHNLQTRS